MLFNSFEYLVFYAIFFCIFFFIKDGRFQIAFIAVSCLFFYGSWKPEHIPLILLVCCAAYLSQITVYSVNLLVPSLVLMLGVLFFFKYYGFLTNQMVSLGVFMPSPNIVLPIGISFYTFHAISFAIDKKRGVISRSRDPFMNIVAYISFFPQLVAGPIVRAARYLPQLRTTRTFNPYMFRTGLILFAIGMFKKVVISDNLGAYVDQVYLHPGEATSGSHWLAFYLYAIQIYYDFSGYSDMAIGIARTLGYKFSVNFNRPYLSASISEFWRRWHISLSSWLRDYLYVSLGGNRRGGIRTYLNLLIVMVLAGLWHGAAWTFIAWGTLLGIFLVIERILGYKPTTAFARVVGIFLTFNVICVSWVLFRSHDFAGAAHFFKGMLDGNTLTVLGTKFTVVKSLFLASLFIIMEMLGKPSSFMKLRRQSYLFLAGVFYVFLFLLLGCFTEHPFIYFQF